MGTSSNFGNMFSAAGASLFLTLPADAALADPAQQPALRHQPAGHPHRQRRPGAAAPPLALGHPRSSAGSCSSSDRSAPCSTSPPSPSCCWVFHSGPAQFRSGWFVESLATQTLIIFAIRTRRIPFFRSHPSLPLTLAALSVVTVGAILPAHAARTHPRLPAPARRLLRRARRHGRLLPGAGRGRQTVLLPGGTRRGAPGPPVQPEAPRAPPCRPLQQDPHPYPRHHNQAVRTRLMDHVSQNKVMAARTTRRGRRPRSPARTGPAGASWKARGQWRANPHPHAALSTTLPSIHTTFSLGECRYPDCRLTWMRPGHPTMRREGSGCRTQIPAAPTSWPTP